MLKIDQNLCDQCGTCIAVCPADALALTEQLAVDGLKCTTCGTCVRVCPFGALAVAKDSKR
jgi:ferredoxin